MFTTFLIFLAILVILVLAHEFGHFLAAKLFGVRVDEFAFGFPPRIINFKKGETNYAFNLLPLGGYVKIQGEEGEDADDPRSFAAQKFWRKITIIAAGVVFNLILAYFLVSFGFILGTPIALDDENINPTAEVRLVEIQKDSPAETSGFKVGDSLLFLSNAQISTKITITKDAQDFIKENYGKSVTVTFKRGGEIISKKVTLRSSLREGEGAFGVVMSRMGIERANIMQAFWKGLKATALMTYFTANALLDFFIQLFTGRANFESVSGPVGIYNAVGDFSNFGIQFLIQLTALLSINLAIINIIPFAGLDGGRIFLLAIEKIKGSPFRPRTSQLYHTIGIAILFLLVILISFNDILKLSS